MGSDRARISYDERQQYRSVVMQQGRVTLEADWNESDYIASEEMRKEALDFVGPAGTPDNGYAITFPTTLPAFDFQVGNGTMYVGGIRSFLPAPVDYAQQSDWLDRAIDPDFVAVPQQNPGNEYVYLRLREQCVSAVEDSDLKDVALGGPDTAERTRLIQHIVRMSTTAQDCAAALAAAQKQWATQGLFFDPATMRLQSHAGLQVGFVTSGTPTPCDPTAQGGYLGADNQMIRVQVSGKGRFLWGFDNASFIYRVDVRDPSTLKLQSMPVDPEHQPQAGIAVEVLMAGAQLANGEYIAAPTGFVTTLATGYNQDTQLVTLQAALPADYGDGDASHPHPLQVFLRVWNQELKFTAGTAVPLGSTGVKVTLTTTDGAAFHVGDYWMFAVRPSTPQQVYPEAYLNAAQPPNGPREWVCPLGIIRWTATGGQVNPDCRNFFDDLVDLTRRKLSGCCTVNVSPADLTAENSLQTIVDRFKGAAGVTVCFMPGQYDLLRPLALGPEHSNFIFEACSGGVLWRVAKGSEAAFLGGMVTMSGARSVTFSGIRFQLPLVPFGSTPGTNTGAVQATVFFSFGLRPVNCDGLTVENCQFDFAPLANASLVAGAIAAGGDCTGLTLSNNRFAMPAVNANLIPGMVSFSAAFTLFPATLTGDVALTSAKAASSAQVLASFLHDALIRDNQFTGLTVPIWVYADCGLVELESNTVRNCVGGFWFVSLPALAFTNNLADVKVLSGASEAAASLQNAVFSAVAHPVIQLASATLRAIPVPDNTDLSKAIKVTVQKPATVAKQAADVQALFDKTFLAASPAAKTAQPPAAAKTADTQVKLSEVAGTLLEHPLASTARIQLDTAAINQNLSVIEKQAFAQPVAREVPVAIHVADNDVSTLVSGAPSIFGFFVANLGKNDKDTVSLTGNTFIGANTSLPIGFIWGVTRCMVTGNLVLNEANNITGIAFIPVNSLWLFPAAVSPAPGAVAVFAAAVTGNVFRGRALLPPRNLNPVPPAPMNTWDFLNSEV